MLNNITFKHRIIGAVFLVSLAVILIPAFFDTPSVDTVAGKESLPLAPELAEGEPMTKIDYAFTELMTDLPPEKVEVAQTDVAPDTGVVEQLATIVEPVEQPAAVPDVAAAPESPLINPELTTASEQSVIASTEKLIIEQAWAVQLGAFSKEENAQELLKRLQEKGYAAHAEHIAHLQLTRVLVGAEVDRAQAAELLAELDKTMHLKGVLVKINPPELAAVN